MYKHLNYGPPHTHTRAHTNGQPADSWLLICAPMHTLAYRAGTRSIHVLVCLLLLIPAALVSWFNQSAVRSEHDPQCAECHAQLASQLALLQHDRGGGGQLKIWPSGQWSRSLTDATELENWVLSVYMHPGCVYRIWLNIKKKKKNPPWMTSMIIFLITGWFSGISFVLEFQADLFALNFFLFFLHGLVLMILYYITCW